MAAVRALAVACNTTANSNNTNDRDTKQQHPSDAFHSGSNGVDVFSGSDVSTGDNASSSSSSSKTISQTLPGSVLPSAVTTLDGVDEHTLFVPAEVHHLRPKVIFASTYHHILQEYPQSKNHKHVLNDSLLIFLTFQLSLVTTTR